MAGPGSTTPAAWRQPSSGLDALAEQAPRLGRRLATAALPFALVTYLAFSGGGYDQVTLGEVGIACWWAVLIALATGLVPVRRLGHSAWVGIALFALFGLWLLLGTTWSESAERSAADAARALSYAGVFGLALLLQGHRGLSRTAGAVAAAIALVGVLALLSRLEPSSFPANETARFLPELADRLNYPLNYWNGLAALMAIGVPLLLAVAMQARYVMTRALAAAAIPVLALVAYYTLSRGGVLEFAVALGVFVAICPNRLHAAPTIAIAVVSSGLLIAAAAQRDLVEEGVRSAAAMQQADEVLAIALVTAGAAGLLVASVTLAQRSGWLAPPPLPRVPAAAGAALAGAATLIVFLAAGGPSYVSDRWDEFKSPEAPTNGIERFESASGNDRWQYWESSVDANESDPFVGIGSGTFEYWWARNGTEPGFVRDAHSLYLETFAESGLVGLGLLLAALGWPLAQAVRRLRGASDERRILLAGVMAAMAAFLAAGVIEWVWELPVLPVTFLLLAAAVLGSRPERAARRPSASGGWALAPRIATGVVAVGALVAIALPLAATKEVRASQADAGAGPAQLEDALAEARRAGDIQPYAATPLLQEALVLEAGGELAAAEEAAALATEKEPTNWRTWLTLSRIQALRGDTGASLDSYRRAKALNPRSSLFFQAAL